MRIASRQSKDCQTACKPGSVPPRGGDGHSSGTSVAGRLARPTRATGAETRLPRETRGAPPLFGLAPGGVCPATAVAGGAVRPYRTVSPLPPVRHAGTGLAVCFLWHCPWGRPRRALPGTVFPWSPDFPHPAPRGGKARPSGRLARCHLRGGDRRVNRRQSPMKASSTALAAAQRSRHPARHRCAPGGSGVGRRRGRTGWPRPARLCR